MKNLPAGVYLHIHLCSVFLKWCFDRCLVNQGLCSFNSTPLMGQSTRWEKSSIIGLQILFHISLYTFWYKGMRMRLWTALETLKYIVYMRTFANFHLQSPVLCFCVKQSSRWTIWWSLSPVLFYTSLLVSKWKGQMQHSHPTSKYCV